MKNDTDDLLNRLQRARDDQRDFDDHLKQITSWLDLAEVRSGEITGRKIAGSLTNIQEQLAATKAFAAEVVVESSQVEKLRRAERSLAQSAKALGASEESLTRISGQVASVDGRVAAVGDVVGKRSNDLQTAITQSLGAQEGISELLHWVRDVELSLGALKPVSLDCDALARQKQEIELIRADVESHQPSLQSVNETGAKMACSCDDGKTSAEIDLKLKNLNDRFAKAAEHCAERESEIRHFADKLSEFEDSLRQHHNWLKSASASLDSGTSAAVSSGELEQLAMESKTHDANINELRQLAKDLVENPLTGDVGAVRDRFTEFDRRWKEFKDLLASCESNAEVLGQRSSEFDDIRKAITDWLTEKEGLVDSLEPVAIDIDILDSQVEQMKVHSVVLTTFL